MRASAVSSSLALLLTLASTGATAARVDVQQQGAVDASADSQLCNLTTGAFRRALNAATAVLVPAPAASTSVKCVATSRGRALSMLTGGGDFNPTTSAQHVDAAVLYLRHSTTAVTSRPFGVRLPRGTRCWFTADPQTGAIRDWGLAGAKATSFDLGRLGHVVTGTLGQLRSAVSDAGMTRQPRVSGTSIS